MKNLLTETMVIPSAAVKLYGDGFDGHITLRAMTTQEERIRLSGQSFYDTMSRIVNECIVDNKKVSPAEDLINRRRRYLYYSLLF